MSWSLQKKRFLSMERQEKRKFYIKKDFVKLRNILKLSEEEESDHSKLTDHDYRTCLDELKGDLLIDPEMDLSGKVSLFKGDITSLEIDAIVNAANNSLLGGGGVDGAIHRGAGPMLRKENVTHGGCGDGEAVESGGYCLPAKYVISTVGPRGENPEILQSAYRSSLEKMLELGLNSIVS